MEREEVDALKSRIVKDLDTCSDEAKASVTKLAKSVLGKDDPEPEHIAEVIIIELSSPVEKVGVYGGEKRQTSISFSSSDVGGSLSCLVGIRPLDLISTSEESNVVDEFIRVMKLMKAAVAAKFERMEDFLRRMLCKSLSKDGLPIPEESRFDGK